MFIDTNNSAIIMQRRERLRRKHKAAILSNIQRVIKNCDGSYTVYIDEDYFPRLLTVLNDKRAKELKHEVRL